MNKKYEILDKFETNKNVDRTRFLENNCIHACYHLQNGKKTGSLYLNQINDNFKFININQKDYDYGILDFKFDKKYIYTSNSDSSCSIINHETLDETEKIKINSLLDQNTCNTLEINSHILYFAMNDGYHHLYDTQHQTFISSIKGHDYGLWVIFNYDNFTYFTGSEDSIMKLWDSRIEKSIGYNKSHTASVNCIKKSIKNTNMIISGSYDEKLRVFDIRKLTETVYEKNLNGSIWDFSHTIINDNYFLFISCVYDGFKILNIDNFSLELELNDLHKSIVYGVDIKEIDSKSTLINSCSFYDNSVILWKFIV